MRDEQKWKGDVWSDDDCERLRTAFRDGGRPAAIRAFPDRTHGSVYSALRRYCFGSGVPPPDGEPTPIPRDEVRARLSAMPLDLFAERLEMLLDRRVDFVR